MKMIDMDANLPHWPQWAYMSDEADESDEYDYGWWTIKDNLVIHVTQTFNSGVRDFFREGGSFKGWIEFSENERNPHFPQEDLDRFKMEQLL